MTATANTLTSTTNPICDACGVHAGDLRFTPPGELTEYTIPIELHEQRGGFHRCGECGGQRQIDLPQGLPPHTLQGLIEAERAALATD